MKENVSAVLAHDLALHMFQLRLLLEKQGVELAESNSINDLRHHLQEAPPHLVFTDSLLIDGNWGEVLKASRFAALPVEVILVSRTADVRLYLDAMDDGVFDCIAPPFFSPDVAHVVRCAAQRVVSRRKDRNRRPRAISTAFGCA